MSRYNKLTSRLVQSGLAQETDADVVAYGLQAGIESLLNVVSTVFIGILLGMVAKSLPFLVSYMLRCSYAGDYHAESALGCDIQSCIMVACELLFCKYLSAGAVTIFAVLLLWCPVIFLLAPVAATHKPLEAIETAHYREKCRKRLVAEAVVLFVLMLLGFGRYALVLATGLFFITA